MVTILVAFPGIYTDEDFSMDVDGVLFIRAIYMNDIKLEIGIGIAVVGRIGDDTRNKGFVFTICEINYRIGVS